MEWLCESDSHLTCLFELLLPQTYRAMVEMGLSWKLEFDFGSYFIFFYIMENNYKLYKQVVCWKVSVKVFWRWDVTIRIFKVLTPKSEVVFKSCWSYLMVAKQCLLEQEMTDSFCHLKKLQ